MLALTAILDARTLAITTMLVYLSLAMIMLHSYVLRKTYPGFGAWTLGICLWAVGAVLSFNTHLLGGKWGVLAANALLLAQLPLLYNGFSLYCNLKYRHVSLRLHLAVTAAILAGITYFTLVHDIRWTRVLLFSSTYAVSLAAIAIELFFNNTPRNPMQRTAAGILAAFSALFWVRSYDNLLFKYTDLTQDPILKLILLLALASTTLLVCTMLIMTAGRVESELVAAQNDLRVLAETDALTGISNRRHFMALARPLVESSRRYHRPLSLVLMDVDLFKHINDTHGHSTGDLVLSELAGLLHGAIREVDVLGRLGGEEFGLLLPETDLSGACRTAERLRALVEGLRPGGHLVTISMGVAAYAEGGLDTLLAQADKELYRAKGEGRNRVCPAPQPI